MNRLSRRRLVGLIALLTFLPLVLLTFLTVRMAADAVHRQFVARTKTTAAVSARLIDRQLEGLKELVESYAQRPNLIAALTEEQDPQLRMKAVNMHVRQLKQAAPGIGTAFLADPAGNLLTIYPRTPSIIGENFAYRDWYRGVTRSDETYVSGAYTSAAAGNPTVVGVAAPVRNTLRAQGAGEATAIIVAAFTTQAIQDFAEGIQSSEAIQLTVADQRGTIVAATDPSAGGGWTDHLLGAALQGRSGVENEGSEGALSAYAPVPDIGWAVLAEVPSRSATTAISTLRSTVFGIAGLLATALLAGLALLSLALNERDKVERERERTQEELVAARRRAIEASRMKSEFLANMSHEIRTPMNGVMGMASLLAGTDLTKEQQEYADAIYRSGDALLTILNDILDFSKVEAGKLEIENIDFDVRTVLEEVGELLSDAAHRKGLELINLIPPNVPDMVKGDPGRLRQVLLNLVGNAIKFTDIGEVVSSVSVIDERDASVSLRFEVCDTGIGIEPEAQERLFRSFSQVDASTTRRYGGTGLGLAVSQQLVSLMGGRIDIDSHLGQGSCFWFEISLERSSKRPEPLLIEHSGLTDLKVLVVDDNETNRRVFEQSLIGWGMNPTCVEDGPTAIALARAAHEAGDPFEVALLDFHMPGMDGIELARQLSSEGALRNIKPLLLTSSAHQHDLSMASAAGIHAYLTKPVKRSALYDTIAAVIGDPSVKTRKALVTDYTLAEAKSGTRRRILVAEDNPVNQKVAARMLEKLGYRVDIATNGQEAVDAVSATDYGVVLMDCQMPVMDGYDATMTIRDLEAGVRRTPIIAMTASAMQTDEDKALAAGMDGYISKPVKIEDLANILEQTLSSEVSNNQQRTDPHDGRDRVA